MPILVTGAAGFIGMHVARRLLDRGEAVVGIDNLNPYYDPALKRARLATLDGAPGFAFERLDFADPAAMAGVAARHPGIDRVIHLGAQAGVRHSIERPWDYLSANLAGQLSLMEFCRALAGRPGGCRSFVYASSSSVYGANREVPFAPAHRTDSPVSFYGATKKACETMAQSYAHLYRIPSTGLRFFTVYGPWGRPDMSPWIFTSRILAGEPIPVFDRGRARRDFTWIDDIASGVVAALDRPPGDGAGEAGAPHRLYNLGNDRPVALMDYIRVIEAACGRRAGIDFQPARPGDMPETRADIADSARDLGFAPETPIEAGIPRFVAWYREYAGV